jgi:hypothetical protein
MSKQMGDIGNGNVQEPNHNVILFLFEQETDVNPEENHKQCDKDCKSKEKVRINNIEIFLKRIQRECAIYEIDEVVIHIAQGICFETCKGFDHLRVH